MTDHYFENELVMMHYYQFGNGAKTIFCFHGYGMHGRQFKVLEESLGERYTFYGFDLFFHKQTRLMDQTLATVKKGISKGDLARLFLAFCQQTGIQSFSVIAYSMGSHYATTLVEEIPDMINELFIAAPSSFRPGRIITFLSGNKIGNKILERLALSDKGMSSLLLMLRKVRLIDQKAYEILFGEIATAELRFSFYACVSYMRFLKLDTRKFIDNLNGHQIRSIFIFGERDKSYPAKIGQSIIPKINLAQKLVINENHDMINANFAHTLSGLLNDN
jgi:pimeloyl-ACP methyl ester carboxylesterase